MAGEQPGTGDSRTLQRIEGVPRGYSHRSWELRDLIDRRRRGSQRFDLDRCPVGKVMPAKIEEARFSASFDSGMDDRPMEWTPPPGGIATTLAAPLRAAELHLQADARRRVEPTVRCSHGRGTKTPTAASTMAVAGLSAPAHVLSGLLALRPAQAKSLRRDVCLSTDLPGFRGDPTQPQAGPLSP